MPFDGILPEKCINYDNDDCLEMMVFRFGCSPTKRNPSRLFKWPAEED